MKGYTVLIPAYKPNENFVELVTVLISKGMHIVAVDDGSGPDFAGLFEKAEQLGITVLRHKTNRGKGAALKTGIAALMQDESIMGVVTADADGQHTVKDITHIMEEMAAHPGALIIGSRAFSGEVPLRSRFGNSVTRTVFRFATGIKINDTQTGLRGLPRNLFKELSTMEGDRYEYEMNMLLNMQRWGVEYFEVPIQTVYIENNASSHFHPLRDSWRIYGRILKYCASSGISFLVDWAGFILFGTVLHLDYWLSYVLARIISSYINYTINRHIVFGTGKKDSIVRYYILAICVMGVGALTTELLPSIIGINSIIAKILIDVPLFVFNYFAQRKYVFRHETAS
jgi:putative flippase GtrA